MATLADLLRQGSDKLTNFSDALQNLPQQAQRFATNPQAFIQSTTGQNLMPKETGFSAGFQGLTPQNPVSGGALNPQATPYTEGYESAEPVAIAAMAVPAYAQVLRAGAPKAYNALENYMVKTGGIQPMIAYHGTPHNIQGGFDIKKVGTGEGAQAYGHGMYFGEARGTGETYKRAGSNLELKYGKPLEEIGINPNISTHSMDFDENPANQALGRIAKGLRTTALDNPDVPLDKKLVKEQFDEYISLLDDKYPKEAAQKKALQDLLAKEGYPDINFSGNLYKVDIPDADIPKMLNWDEVVPESIRKPISEAMMQDFGTGATRTSGRDLYNEVVFEMRRNGSASPEADASNYLLSKGVSGVRYLDEGSRGNFTAQTTYKGKPYSDIISFKSQDQLNDFIKEKKAEGFGVNTLPQTSNFVVFEPSTVKILEKNDVPVSRKEIIAKQFNK